MDQDTLRSWWWHRQGLDGGISGKSSAAVLETAGWARSVGGAGPYLGIHARCGASREAIDGAVAAAEIHELPSARGCTYVVPRADFALALRVGQAFADDEMKTARKLGVTDAEVDKLGAAVVTALRNAALEPDEIRAAVGGAARSLGEEGKKKGLTTTLPLSLGRLQAAGEIRRIPANGRLDQQRYRYAVWRPNPLTGDHLSPAEADVELARRYFGWIAPATLAEFRWFSGLGVKAAAAAVAPLGLEPLGSGDDRLMPPALLRQLRSFRPPAKPQYALVSSLDTILLLRRNLASLMGEGDLGRKLPCSGGKTAASSLKDLPSHAILDRGRVAGLWEYDTESGRIAWMSLAPAGAALREAVARTEAWVRAELGDARAFSLDSPKSRAPRIAELRAACQ